jgi:threonylcarbamoyladenosine tRNA methylthiotransferase MtaB
MATPKSVAFYTLGCKLNFSETSSIGRLFEGAGYSTVEFDAGADIFVINTCSVTDYADRKCRQIVRRALRTSPHAFVVVVGCYAQLKPAEIAAIPGVDLVLGASEKFKILDFIDSLSKAPGKGMVQTNKVSEARDFVGSFSFGDRTRSFLKVQDGCDYKCTFCTIPQARGASRSYSVENVVRNVERIAGMGVKEIVLTGVNIGDFGNGTAVIEGERPQKEALFLDLIRALDRVSGISRFRISSIEPNLCTDQIIRFVAASERFAPHFHMPLQSGSNSVLALMRRRYRRELYAERVASIKKHMPHACIGVDVIVGFPGETVAEFQETRQFLADLDISYLHVFTYSERPNTPAIEMPDPVPVDVRRQRNEILTALSDRKQRQFYEQHIGQRRKVLFETSKIPGMMSGFTDNYIRIEAPLQPALVNQLSQVVLQRIGQQGLVEILPGSMAQV